MSRAEPAGYAFEAYLRALRRYFAKRIGRAEIEDAIQDVLLRVSAHEG